jgi:hypothetical protein
MMELLAAIVIDYRLLRPDYRLSDPVPVAPPAVKETLGPAVKSCPGGQCPVPRIRWRLLRGRGR